MFSKIILDIEGTVSPISFVKDVLFPYSRAKMKDFFESIKGKQILREILGELKKEFGEINEDEIHKIFEKWIDEDRKIKILKDVQGMIWEEGYRNGELVSPIYEDAFLKMKQWKSEGKDIYIYSSGSKKAQILFFKFTNYGDITYLITDFFDLSIGSKKSPSSYKKILDIIHIEPGRVLFVSDNEDEVSAAKEVKIKSILIKRDEYIKNSKTLTIRNFYELDEIEKK